MTIYNIEENYKNKIESIWNDEKYQSVPFIERGYAVQKEIILNSILFIGINPSYNEKNINDTESFFYDNPQQELLPQYFRKFQHIAKETNIKWSHHDLLFIRQTNQKLVKSLFNYNLSKEFLERQLRLSISIIEQSKPKVLIISNAYARNLFSSHIKTIFDKKLGTRKVINNDFLENVPVFFTSMLTGQRALDNGSYERLIWHINMIFDNN